MFGGGRERAVVAFRPDGSKEKRDTSLILCLCVKYGPCEGMCSFPSSAFSIFLNSFFRPHFPRKHSITLSAPSPAVTGACLSALNWREQGSEGKEGVNGGSICFCLDVFKKPYD